VRVIYPGTKTIPDSEASEESAHENASISGESRFPSDITVPEGCFVFVCLARLSAEKGLRFLIESADLLKRVSDIPFVILIAGEGAQREELEDLTEALGLKEHVKLLGFRDDCDAILSGADAYISPSRSESFGFSVIEAMAHGLPVIATDVGGSRDIIGGGADCGLLVPYGDKQEMAAAMSEMIQKGAAYERRAANARQQVRERFSISAFAQKTFEVYKHVINYI
jgi:glycosyltransferase involved in cell wall biosynthesis